MIIECSINTIGWFVPEISIAEVIVLKIIFETFALNLKNKVLNCCNFMSLQAILDPFVAPESSWTPLSNKGQF